MSEDTHLQVLRILEKNPEVSQRQLATELGISLGKANYCLKALLDKGWVKARNFKNNKNKIGYAYLLTPGGIEAKTKLTVNFLRRKMQEYEELRQEIDQLQQEVDKVEGSKP